MYKFFVDNSKVKDEKIVIDGTDVNHIINVLRLKKTDKILICEKETMQNFICEIEDFDKERVGCKIIEKTDFVSESNVKLDVYQGLPKADKMELIIQKETEIGASKIIPVQMDRCIVKLDGKDSIKKIDRWQKIAEVAAKQSKRDIIPKIENLQNINYVVNIIKDYDLFIVFYEEERNLSLKETLKQLDKNKDYKIGILIGPEGGIDINEINILKQNGAKIVTLGNRILRTETAPIVASSIIMYELEN